MLNMLEQQDARVRVIRNTNNIGLTASLNRGLTEARGKYIARLDSDDIATPNRIEQQLTFLRSHPKYPLIGSFAFLINGDDEIIGEKTSFTSPKDIQKHLLSFNFFTHSSFFFRKNAILKVGGYTETMKHTQDYDLLFKLAAHYPLAILNEYLTFYRITPNNISEAHYKRQEYYAVHARLRALFRYGFGKIHIYQVILPILSFLILPTSAKKFLITFSQRFL